MHPILFETSAFTLYSYGAMIALGIVAGMGYLIVQGRREAGLSFDQANYLFLGIFFAAVVGGKLFLFFEAPSHYIAHPADLVSGRGFVFFGSFLLAVPTMLWLFRKFKLPSLQMLDIMAVTTCLVHSFGRLGCFLAGCCYGVPTDSWIGVVYSDPACYADPLHTPLVPTQLLESVYILIIAGLLLAMRSKRTFYGQLFFMYLLLYSAGRFVLEFFRGDAGRGYIGDTMISHSQFVALGIILVSGLIYIRQRVIANNR